MRNRMFDKNPSRECSETGSFFYLKFLNPLKSRLLSNKKGSIFFYQNMLPFMVEMTILSLSKPWNDWIAAIQGLIV